MKFNEYRILHESLGESLNDVLSPLVNHSNSQHPPFSINDMVNALSQAHHGEDQQATQKAIDMLDQLLDYVITLTHKNSSYTVKGIMDIKNKLISLLKAPEPSKS